MNSHIILGLFGLYVAIVSLCLVLTGYHDPLLALLRRWWGRVVGHALYFAAYVALPCLIFLLCVGWGVRQYGIHPVTANGLSRHQAPLQLHIKDAYDTLEPHPEPFEKQYFILLAA